MTTQVRSLSQSEATESVLRSLRLPVGASPEALVGQAIRRASSFMAPCTPSQLQRAVQSSLGPWVSGLVAEFVGEIVESLVVYGDLLELRPLDDDTPAIGKFVLRPSPPCFVRHNSGIVYLVGVAGDEVTPLAQETSERVRFVGPLRVLDPIGSQDIAANLQAAGLPELTAQSWLRLPPTSEPDTYVRSWQTRLDQAPRPSAIEGLTVFTGSGERYYAGRRVTPSSDLSGIFVGRRPQLYGADLWCLVVLSDGTPTRLLDVVSEGDRVRPCDVAWRILFAMDAVAGHPQRVRLRQDGENTILDFFAPLPSWAERWLALSGQRVRPERCLLSHSVPSADLAHAMTFLHEKLWIEPGQTTAGVSA